ncbi:hypothetical protein Vadar_001799 [Vaccinium darrowii]|uniref:Uncharacterized protein n=1 Tax=Vaccinium darrowii TaxID=229202 RepID=A0ACB7YIM6_9ERIC|nr:hypothetical protein Vadar_001799 [Vaccinium darrowii]
METPTELVLKEVTDVDDDLSSLSLFGKILSQRTLNKLGVTNILNQAWKTKESFSISPWRDNIFLFRFKTASDKNFVLNSGPWSIMGHLLVLKEIQKGLTLEAMDFSLCPFWVQIHGLPITCMTSANAKKIGTQFDALIDVDDIPQSLRRKYGFSSSMKGLQIFAFNAGLGHEKNSCKFQPATLYGGTANGHDLKTATPQILRIKDSTKTGLSQMEGKEDESGRRNLVGLEMTGPKGVACETTNGDPSHSGVQDNPVNPNLVVSNIGNARNFGRVPRGIGEREDTTTIISSSEYACSPCSVRLPCCVEVHSEEKSGAPAACVLQSTSGLNGPKIQQGLSMLQQAQSSGPSYFVTEPDSPKGDITVTRPTSTITIGPDNKDEESPTLSPRISKREAYMDIVLAHVFDDLSLKRKAPEDPSIVAEKSVKIKEDLHQQMWSTPGGNHSNHSNLKSQSSGGRRRVGRHKGPIAKATPIIQDPLKVLTLFNEDGLVDAPLLLSQDAQNIQYVQDVEQASQVQSTFKDEVSLSPSDGGVVVAVPQQPQGPC